MTCSYSDWSQRGLASRPHLWALNKVWVALPHLVSAICAPRPWSSPSVCGWRVTDERGRGSAKLAYLFADGPGTDKISAQLASFPAFRRWSAVPRHKALCQEPSRRCCALVPWMFPYLL